MCIRDRPHGARAPWPAARAARRRHRRARRRGDPRAPAPGRARALAQEGGMIARLRGTLIERGEDFVVIECGGVGYEVSVSLTTLAQLPGLDAEVTLRVFTHALESKITLYGFAEAPEREPFD